MPLPRRRRVAAGLLAALVIDAGFAIVSSAPAGAARSSAVADAAGAQAKKAVATLTILEGNVSVRRKGKDEFKPAKDGQKLRVGDSIQTDDTGFAQINYTDESFTRLDVNTTFTIVSLTDDEGNRQIEGTLDVGRTWSRTSALTESESFEQEGAGATAAVIGTAYSFECDGAGKCVLTTVVDGVTYSTVDGELKVVDPLHQCEADEVVTDQNTDLCEVPEALSIEALLANDWIMQNLFLDGLLGFEGVIVVENGLVTSVSGTQTSSTGETTPIVIPAPVIDPENPVLVESCAYAYPGDVCGEELRANESIPNPDFPAQGLYGYSYESIFFTINAGAGESGLPFFIVFSALPDSGFGTIAESDGLGGYTPVAADTQYAADTLFVFFSAFAPFSTAPITGNFEVPITNTQTMVHVENAASAGEDVVIPITTVIEVCIECYPPEAVEAGTQTDTGPEPTGAASAPPDPGDGSSATAPDESPGGSADAG